MLNRNVVGRASSPALNEVERGAIRRFAEAIGDFNPIFYDDDYARASGFPGVVAPITFPATFRSQADLSTLLGANIKRVLHAEQSFEYERPILAGDRIWVTSQIEEVFERSAPGGPVDVVVLVDLGVDESGSLIFKAKRTLIVRVSKEVAS